MFLLKLRAEVLWSIKVFMEITCYRKQFFAIFLSVYNFSLVGTQWTYVPLSELVLT